MNNLQRQVLIMRQTKVVQEKVSLKESVAFSTPVSGPDRRYRILVSLIRSDRPRYWHFLCFNCGSKIVELQNLEVYTIDDFYDPQNVNNSGIGRHCTGQGNKCPYSYFFHVE